MAGLNVSLPSSTNVIVRLVVRTISYDAALPSACTCRSAERALAAVRERRCPERDRQALVPVVVYEPETWLQSALAVNLPSVPNVTV